eukprot:CAMPEP_0170570852 /NCGR_PEP_ID=MMETSP0224-20130122/1338_1 /TAXON_ID=285029 /ORGANISM="Togula jolla, Strain CCCM 725" /LENGTH=86 /DNA_ID=CAMNT_0010893171 /DNA_START=1175 /DNA_END=1435 /DNA_ORIENTATION=+
MRHHVHLTRRSQQDVVEDVEDVTNIAAPAANKDLLHSDLFYGLDGRTTSLDRDRRLRPIGIIILCDDDDGILTSDSLRRTWVQEDH